MPESSVPVQLSPFSVFTNSLLKLVSAAKWRAALGVSTQAEILAAAYPVGSIYVSTVSTNPATALGFGTWTAFGAGRVPVGYSAGDPDFGTDGATGGEKTHTLTTTEMPAHTHAGGASSSLTNTTTGGAASRVTAVGPGTDWNTGSAGSGGAHNNLQPFIVVRMWQRTA